MKCIYYIVNKKYVDDCIISFFYYNIMIIHPSNIVSLLRPSVII